MRSMKVLRILSLTALAVFLIGCESEEIIEDGLVNLEFTHTKSPVSSAVSFSIRAKMDSSHELTNNQIVFSSGDGSETICNEPSLVVEEDGYTLFTYNITYTYPAPSNYLVAFWLDEFEEDKLEEMITVDPS